MKDASFTVPEGSKLHVEDAEAAIHFSYYDYRIRFLGQDIDRHLAGEPLTD